MTTLEKSVSELDAYKRRVGRKFDRATTREDVIWYFNKYNEIEDTIVDLVNTYHIPRKAKPNKLKLESLTRRLEQCSK